MCDFSDNCIFEKLSPLIKKKNDQWWCIPVIPALERLKQEDQKVRPAWAT
jgi:hypothetical protein